jgi:hypothetical protein
MVETLPWNLPLRRLLAELGATRDGLSGEEVERRLTKYGPNDALAHRRRPLWRQLLDRFANPLILILLFASGLSAWTGEVTSFALIVGIILLSVVLDVVQQARAENTVDALRRSVGLKAEALRDGTIEEVAVDRLVPGDVVELKAGEIVPGDCRLPVRQPGPAHGRSLSGGEARGGSSVSRRGARASGELPVHGHLGHQRHRNGPRRSHRARDRTWRTCPWTRHGAATGCV